MYGARTGKWEKSATCIRSSPNWAPKRDTFWRQLEELVEQTKLVHHVQCRGMDGVAAKVAQEVGVLLQHQHIHAGARQTGDVTDLPHVIGRMGFQIPHGGENGF